MPRYYRRRWRPRRRYRRWFKRRFRRFVNGSSKSTVRVKIPVSFTHDFTQAANTNYSDPYGCAPLFQSSSKCSALSNALYTTYCQLYDEVKVIGMKVRINVSSAIGGADIPSLQIYTAFDRRKGNSGDAGPTGPEMKTYSTFQCATAVNNSVAKLERSIYASDLMEKAQWHDCSLSGANPISDGAFVAAGANPNFFHPCLYTMMSIPNVTAQTTVHTSFDVMYYFAFRNPKYGAAAGASKLEVETLERRIPPPPAEGGGDMDVDVAALPDDYELNIDDPLGQETIDAAAAAIPSVERTPVTSVSFSRAMHNAGVVTAAHQAAVNRAERRRLEGKNV